MNQFIRWRHALALVTLVVAGACSQSSTAPARIAQSLPSETSSATATTAQARATAETVTPVSPGVPAAATDAEAEVSDPPPPESAHASAAAPTIPLHPFLPAGGRARVVAIDPGHGGAEVGAAGAGVAEKDINLRVAFKLRDMLEQDGMRVVLTRDSDRRAAEGQAAPGYSATRIDLQARLDTANAARADVFLSLHNNGSPNGADTGTEVWWDGKRPFAAYNRALAEQVLASLVGSIRATGYPTVDRGLKEDSQFRVFQGRTFPIFVLGPPRTGVTTSRAGLMPAVLGESLFLSNPSEAQQLTRDEMLTAIARGYREGVTRYFRLIDQGALALPADGLPLETPNFYNITPPPPQGGSAAAPR